MKKVIILIILTMNILFIAKCSSNVDKSIHERVFHAPTIEECEIIKLLGSDSEPVREEAFRKIVESKGEAVPALMYGLGGNWGKAVSDRSIDAIAELGKDAVPMLIAALNYEEEEIRWVSTMALKFIETEDKKEAIPSLLNALKDEAPAVRSGAVQILAEFGSNPTCVSSVIDTLEDKDDDVRFWAAFSITELGVKAKAAVPKLIDLLENPYVRESALWALGSIGPDASSALPRLCELADETENDPELNALIQLTISRIDVD